MLIDNVPRYACSVLTHSVRHAAIRTIEGLASPDGTLHPVQEAFIAALGPQCGFCTPGQIMSTVGLLAVNPRPTRAEAAEALSGNLCCGAYDHYLNAVMLAAQRGLSMAAYTLIGKDFIPPDLRGKVTGAARYAEDFRVEGMLFAKLLTSPMPHAKVRHIDASKALAMPGVVALLTADDVPQVTPPQEPILTNEPLYAGEPILAVAAVDETTAAEAIEQINVDLQPLPFVIDPSTACGPGDPTPAPRGMSPTRACLYKRSSGRRVILPTRARAVAHGQAVRRMAVWQYRRGLCPGRAGARRHLRDAGHVTPFYGTPLGAGLLAARQTLPARLDPEYGLRRPRNCQVAGY